MGAAASGKITANFGDRSRGGVLVADFISDLGIGADPGGSSLLHYRFFSLLAISVFISSHLSPDRPF